MQRVLLQLTAAAQKLVACTVLVAVRFLHWALLWKATYRVPNQTLRVQLAILFWTTIGDALSLPLTVYLIQHVACSVARHR